jgi:hypothetical protein
MGLDLISTLYFFSRRFSVLVDLGPGMRTDQTPCHTSTTLGRFSFCETQASVMTAMTATFQSRVDLLWPVCSIHIRDGPHYLMGTVMVGTGFAQQWGPSKMNFPAPEAAQNRFLAC